VRLCVGHTDGLDPAERLVVWTRDFLFIFCRKNERLSSDSDLRFMKLIYELELDSLGLGREWTNVSYRSKTREHAHTQTPGRLR